MADMCRAVGSCHALSSTSRLLLPWGEGVLSRFFSERRISEAFQEISFDHDPAWCHHRPVLLCVAHGRQAQFGLSCLEGEPVCCLFAGHRASGGLASTTNATWDLRGLAVLRPPQNTLLAKMYIAPQQRHPSRGGSVLRPPLTRRTFAGLETVAPAHASTLRSRPVDCTRKVPLSRSRHQATFR